MPNRVVSVEHQVLHLELTEPFGIAGGSHDVASIVVVQVRLEDGSVGLGEAAPLPAYNGETIADVELAVGAAGPRLVGAEAANLAACAEEIAPFTRQSAAARAALEVAVLDAHTRSTGSSMRRWFGAGTAPNLETDVTIPIVPPDSARAAARAWRGKGFRQIKIKIGGGEDVARILAVHEGAPDAQLLLDANGGLTAAQALGLLTELARYGAQVALFEQPVPKDDWDGLAQVAQRCRVALDESVVTAADARLAAERLGSAAVINIKLMKSGLVGALEIASVARKAGLSLMIGGMVESELAMSASASFALGLGGFSFIDLDTPLFLRDSPFQGALTYQGSTVRLGGDGLGHGARWRSGEA